MCGGCRGAQPPRSYAYYSPILVFHVRFMKLLPLMLLNCFKVHDILNIQAVLYLFTNSTCHVCVYVCGHMWYGKSKYISDVYSNIYSSTLTFNIFFREAERRFCLRKKFFVLQRRVECTYFETY